MKILTVEPYYSQKNPTETFYWVYLSYNSVRVSLITRLRTFREDIFVKLLLKKYK